MSSNMKVKNQNNDIDISANASSYDNMNFVRQMEALSEQQNNSRFDNTLRKAEQLATAGLDGISLGWIDELEGGASALGYGIASLNPNWNKTGESTWEAMKRGYKQGRDNRRQVLADGYRENPVATTAMQMVGAFASPIKIGRYSKTAPLGIKNATNLQNAIGTGVIYGLGSGQDGWLDYALNIGSGVMGNGAGHLLSKQAFGRAASPAIRNAFSTVAGKASQSALDGTKNLYNNYSKY